MWRNPTNEAYGHIKKRSFASRVIFLLVAGALVISCANADERMAGFAIPSTIPPGVLCPECTSAPGTRQLEIRDSSFQGHGRVRERENERKPTDNEVAVLVRESRADKLIQISADEAHHLQRERPSPDESAGSGRNAGRCLRPWVWF